MSYKVCTQERELASIIWSVIGTFGYVEAVFSDEENKTSKLSRLAVDQGDSYTAIIEDCNNSKAMAELAAVAVEVALAVGFPKFNMKVSCSSEVAELLYLYGLDDYMDIENGEFAFVGFSGRNEIFRSCTDNALKCVFNLTVGAEAIGVDEHPAFSETVVFAEPGAEGIAYEVAYTMRLSGCLVKNYLGDGTIEECEKYAVEDGISAVIRVHKNGKIQIKEMADGSITETDYNTFANYYSDEEEECDCGHDHHHHEGCSCGHDHNHHEGCNCGHEHHHDGCSCGHHEK